MSKKLETMKTQIKDLMALATAVRDSNALMGLMVVEAYLAKGDVAGATAKMDRILEDYEKETLQ